MLNYASGDVPLPQFRDAIWHEPVEAAVRAAMASRAKDHQIGNYRDAFSGGKWNRMMCIE